MKEKKEKRLYGMLIALLLFALLLTAVLWLPHVKKAQETPVASAVPRPTVTPLPQTANYPREMRYNETTATLRDKIIRDFVSDGVEGMDDIREILADYERLDRGMAELWTRIMDEWAALNTDLHLYYDELPDGLPTDDRLCLVVLGYALESDGGMAEELVQRCTVALAGAEKYPNAYVLVTGGPTAFLSDSTEAGCMAAWLIAHGVAEERLIVEDQALTTAQNALYGAKLLRRFPQVDSLAIITSDYHIAVGSLMFEAEALAEEYERGEKPFSVVANAACSYPTKAGTQGISVQSAFLRSLMNPTARYQ